MGSLVVILLDTHVLVWMDADDKRLGENARAAIEKAFAGGNLTVSAIAFWEIAMLVRDRRLQLPQPVAHWRLELLNNGLRELPLDGATMVQAVALDLPHKDPADRFIAAAALTTGATLLTADARILESSVGLLLLDARL